MFVKRVHGFQIGIASKSGMKIIQISHEHLKYQLTQEEEERKRTQTHRITSQVVFRPSS